MWVWGVLRIWASGLREKEEADSPRGGEGLGGGETKSVILKRVVVTVRVYSIRGGL